MTYTPHLLLVLTLTVGPSFAAAAATHADLSEAGCAVHLVEPPAPESVAAARATVQINRLMLEQILESRDLARLDAALASENLDVASRLINHGWSALVSKMSARAEALRVLLADKREIAQALNNLGTAARVAELEQLLNKCVESRRPFVCRDVWYGARRYVRRELVPMLPGPINEVDRLDVLVTSRRKTNFKRDLEEAYVADMRPQPWRRKSAKRLDNRWNELAVLPDLNRALTNLFVDVPSPIQFKAMAGLRGLARVGDQVVRVDVIFHPRKRYVTLQASHVVGERPRYFGAELTTDDLFHISTIETVPAARVDHLLRQTHFRY